MNTSKPWSTLASALVLTCVACGSSFQANEASSAGSDSGGVAQGGSLGSAGTSSRGGRTGQGGQGTAGGVSTGGTVSVGGDLGIAGDLSIGGSIGIAGGTSSGGAVGSSGSTSSGGVTSGGSTSGGNVGTGGSGGTSGAGGTGGGTGANCGALWSTYLGYVAKAQVCDAGSTVECIANSNVVNECNCAIPVNHNSAYLDGAKKALQNWKDAGCIFKVCPCVAQGSPVCQLSSGTYLCQATPIITPN